MERSLVRALVLVTVELLSWLANQTVSAIAYLADRDYSRVLYVCEPTIPGTGLLQGRNEKTH